MGNGGSGDMTNSQRKTGYIEFEKWPGIFDKKMPGILNSKKSRLYSVQDDQLYSARNDLGYMPSSK